VERDEDRKAIVKLYLSQQKIRFVFHQASVKFVIDRNQRFTLHCPTAYPTDYQDDNFFVEADSSLQLWCNALNEFLLDTAIQVTKKGLAYVWPKCSEMNSDVSSWTWPQSWTRGPRCTAARTVPGGRAIWRPGR
jgi:hypothetical protein